MSQNSQENTCAIVYFVNKFFHFLIKLQAKAQASGLKAWNFI